MGKIRQTIEETVKYMWRSQKNRLFMAISIGAMLVYVLLFAPNFNSYQDINLDDLESDMAGNIVQTEYSKREGYIVPSSYTGTTAYIEQQNELGNQREIYTILKHGDAQRYLEEPSMITVDNNDEPTEFASLFYDIFGQEPFFLKGDRYLEEVDNINFHIIHEITSLQRIHLFLLGAGSLILLSGLVFMISDVHTKDQNLASQKLGTPLNWRSYLLVQSLTALGFVFLFYTVFFGLFYLINGLLHGFGGLHYPISFPQETIGWFLIRALPYFLLLSLLFTRLNTLFSLWTKQSVVTMGLLIFIIFSAGIYLDINAIDQTNSVLMYLPITYINFGRILTAAPVEGLPIYNLGLVVLGITYLLTEISLYITTKVTTRQKFTALGAN